MKSAKNITKRIISLVLAFVICFSAMPLTAFAADKTGNDNSEITFAAEETNNNTGDNEAEISDNSSEQNKSSQQEETVFDINNVLNNAELHPQKTGYATLDKMLENIVAPLNGKTTAQKVAALYEWTVYNIDYSWAGYKEQTYNGFNVPYPLNDYETGLQKVIPQEIIDRTYFTMKNHKGVCYDWAAVFCVMMRYIGLESYVHTGMFRFEWETQIGHHGWAEVEIDGVNYIFDPQREYRMTDDGTKPVDYSRYFGLRYQDTNRYNQETSVNAARDAGFVSVTATRGKTYAVNAVASPMGTVSGGGNYESGAYATLIAMPNSGKSFDGWYDTKGNMVSAETVYSFTVNEKTTLYAMFGGDNFYDIKADAWYYKEANKAADLNLVNGQSLFCFNGSAKMTRAMVVQILANMEGGIGNMGIENPFTDVKSNVWYTNAVLWAVETGIVNGMGNGKFCPNDNVTREQFMTMIINYLNFKTDDGINNGSFGNLKFKDKNNISTWARESVAAAVELGFAGGYEDNTIKPKNLLTRAEGVKIIVKTYDYINILDV